MHYLRAMVAVLAVGLSGCFKSSQTINPPQLVSVAETDMAIQLFMQATLMMAKYYGYTTLSYEKISERHRLAGFSTLPFMPPITTRATPRFDWSRVDTVTFDEFSDFINSNGLQKQLVKYYIKTGWKASQLLCRNFLLNLDERNRYFQFLKEELGFVYALSDTVLALVDANGTLVKSFSAGKTFLTSTIGAYEKYRFGVDAESVLIVVETTQDKYAAHFMRKVDDGGVFLASADDKNPYDPKVPFTFSEALHAVSTIEYQCTQSGINYLLHRAVNNTPTNLQIDKVTGMPVFNSTLDNTKPPADDDTKPKPKPKPSQKLQPGVTTPLTGQPK